MMRKISATALSAFLLLAPVHAAMAETNTSETYRQLNLFGDVFERVRAEYVEEVTDEQLVEAAINGMLTALDPHSSYLNSKNFQDMQVQTRGEFGGLGIEVTMEDGLIKVVSPIDETPAFRAGLQPGDLITHLDGEAISGLALSDAVDRMRGPVGSDIVITIRRGAATEPFDVTLTRDVIRIQSVRYRPEGRIGYVRITTFNEQTQSGLEKAMENLEQEIGADELVGYVIDLRNNPGGLLDQAVSVSDSFLDKGEIVSTRSRHAADGQRYNAKEGDLAKGKPIVVLINGGSASASEIVAGALQDHQRAILLGTPSFGKGSVQTIIPLPGHGAMRLTTARYYTPSGRSIQQLGIAPDIEVQPARIEELAEVQRRRETDLRGALNNDDAAQGQPAPPAGDGDERGAPETLPGPGASAAPPAEDETGEPAAAADDAEEAAAEVDYQLARAIDLLRGVSLFNARAVN